MSRSQLARWWPVGLGLAALLLGGCASGRARTATKPRLPGDAFTGRWAGTWHSEKTGHRGKLWCDFTKTGPTVYQADFRAQWMIFRGSYSLLFHTRQVGQELHFAGEHRLPAIFGGLYRFHGSATNTHFLAKYAASNDYGTFTMHKEVPPRTRPAALRSKNRVP